MLFSPRLSVPPSLVWLLSDHNHVVVTTISNFIIHTVYFKKRPGKEQVLLPSMHLYITFLSSPRHVHLLLNLTHDRTSSEELISRFSKHLEWQGTFPDRNSWRYSVEQQFSDPYFSLTRAQPVKIVDVAFRNRLRWWETHRTYWSSQLW